jgi:outer membrane protein TolC
LNSRFITLIASIAFLYSGAWAQEMPSKKPITTLDEAISIALAKTPAVLIAEGRMRKTEKTVSQVLGLTQPQINFTAGYTRLANQASGFGGGGGGGAQLQNPFQVGLQGVPPGSQPVTLGSSGGATRQQPATDPTTGGGSTGGFKLGGSLNQGSASVSVSQLIDITGVLKTTIALGDLEKALTLLELERTKRETVLNVKNGYYNVLRAEAFVTVNEAAVTATEELVRVTEAQKNAGVAAEFDVLRAKTQLENNKQALISAKNQFAISRNAFANSIGVDPATPIAFQQPSSVPTSPALDESPLVAKALQQRPEAQQAVLNQEKAVKSTKIAHRTMEPSLSASLSGTYNPSPNALSSKQTGSFGLSFSLPLSDGGTTKAAVDSAKLDERIALVQKEQFYNGIKAEVEQAIIAIKDAQERSKSTSQTVIQAREAYRLANVRFKAGVDTQLAVNDSQTALVQSEVNKVNAEYDYLAALARLLYATGEKQ